MSKHAKRLSLAPKYAHEGTWHWYPPHSGLRTVDYADQMRSDARRWAGRPELLELYPRTGEVRADANYRRDEGYSLKLCATIGGGWGSSEVARIAEWAGGKRWILSDTSGTTRRDALNKLDLPECDGRLLLIGAPPRPDKGVTAWRNRWTVKRSQASGLVAVAGEGIEPASVLADLRERLKGLEAQRDRCATDAERYARDAEDLATRAPMIEARAARVMHLLERFGVQADDGTPVAALTDDHGRGAAWRLSYHRRNRSTRQDRSDQLQARAAERLAHYAAQDSTPLTIGVRCTHPDGTPNNARGPYSDAHEVGLPATAPDWNPRRECGNGLHYVPRVSDGGSGTVRAADYCVTAAMRYGQSDSYALWIVRAGDERVAIDREKAKAETLTPLERVGSYQARRRGGGLALQALALADTREREESTARHYAAENTRQAASLAKQAEQTKRTIQEWRKTK